VIVRALLGAGVILSGCAVLVLLVLGALNAPAAIAVLGGVSAVGWLAYAATKL
jgi:hypothetical protein